MSHKESEPSLTNAVSQIWALVRHKVLRVWTGFVTFNPTPNGVLQVFALGMGTYWVIKGINLIRLEYKMRSHSSSG